LKCLLRSGSEFFSPYRHSVARHQVADRGMTCSREYVESALADSRQGVLLQPGGLAMC